MTIKAIETIYNGYRFRSRLEARWAVFFDTLGIKYQYEPEGYDLGEHGYYLPDFYLPDAMGGCWCEIKPMIEKVERGDSIVGKEFDGLPEMYDLVNMTHKRGIIFYGLPYPNEYFCITIAGMDFEPSDYAEALYQCLDCGVISIGDDNVLRVFKDVFGDNRELCFYCSCPETNEIHLHLSLAYNAARQARFEHGETPQF